MRRRTGLAPIALLALLLAALAVVACGSDDSSSADSGDSTSAENLGEPFALGTQPWIGYGPLTAIAPQEGIFEEEGLTDVEIVNFKSDKDINAAFASKQLDAVSVGITQALTFAEAGVPIKIVLLEDVSSEADAILAKGVDSVADLEGKKVAVEEGTVGDMMLRYALSEEGLTIDDVDPVPLPAADAGAAMIAGQVDAAVTYEPYITEAQAKDADIEPIFTAGDRPGLISDMLIVSEDVIADRPGQVQAIVDSWGKAVDFLRENPDEGQRLIAEDLGSSVKELETAFEGVTFYDIEQNQEQLSGELQALVEDVQSIMIEAGLMETEVDVDALIDSQFVDAGGSE